MPAFGGVRGFLGWATIGIKADASRLKQDVRREGQEAAREEVRLNIHADTSKFRPEVQKEVKEVEASIEQAIRTFADTQRYREDLEAKVKAAAAKVKAETGVEIPQAELNRQVRRAVKVAQATAPKVKVETEVDENAIGGWTKLRRVLIGAAGGALGFKAAIFAIKWPAIQAAGQQLAAAITTLSAALTALTGSTLLVGGALGALPGIFASILQAVGAVAVAFMGVGDAIKASSKSIQDNGNIARQNARAQQQAARRVEDAYRNRAEAAEAAAEREQRANEEVTQAVENYGRVQEQVAEQQVRDAERVEAAERRLARAQEQHRRAQEDLTRAREDEARALADMRREQERLAMDEEAQILAVEEAKEAREATFEDEGSSERERKRADLRYRQEKARLEDIRRARQENRDAMTKAEREGIEGSERVRAAREREADAALAVRDAEREMAEARKDQARNAAEGAEMIAAAYAAIGQAEKERTRTFRDNARTMEDAARAVEDALQAVEDAAINAARNIDPLAEAMNKLSPPAQRFVNYILSLRPQFEELKATVAAGLFPGLEAGIRGAMTNFESLKRRLRETGEVVGGLASDMGKLMASDMFRDDFDRIMGNNNRLLRDMGEGFINIFSAIRHLMIGAEDLTQWLGESFRDWTKWIEKTLEAKRETGALKEFFDNVRESLSKFFEIFGNVWSTLFNIFKAGNETGQGFLDSMVKVTQQWQDWSRSVEGNKTLQNWFNSAKAVMRELSALLAEIFRAVFDISGEGRGLAGTLKFLRTDILPVLVNFFKSADTKVFLKNFLTLLRDLMDIFSKLISQTGPLRVFVDVLGKFLSGIAWIVNLSPTIAGSTATMFGLYKVLKLFGVISLGKWIGELMGVNWGQLATKLLGFGKAADDVAGAVGGAGKAARTGGGLLGALGRVAGFLRGGGVWGVAIAAGILALQQFMTKTEAGQKLGDHLKENWSRMTRQMKQDWSDFTLKFKSDSDQFKAKLKELNPAAEDAAKRMLNSQGVIARSYAEHGRITAEAVTTVTANVNKIHEAVVTRADDQAAKSIAATEKLASQTGLITEEQRRRWNETATNQRNEVVARSDEARIGIIAQIEALRAKGIEITDDMARKMVAEVGSFGTESIDILETNKTRNAEILTLLQHESQGISRITRDKLRAEAIGIYEDSTKAAEDTYRENIRIANEKLKSGEIAGQAEHTAFVGNARRIRNDQITAAEEAKAGTLRAIDAVGIEGAPKATASGKAIETHLNKEMERMGPNSQSTARQVIANFREIYDNIGKWDWRTLWDKVTRVFRTQSPSLMMQWAENSRKGVTRSFERMAGDIGKIRLDKLGPTARFDPGPADAFDASGGGAVPGGGGPAVKIDNLNVTSQHPGDIAGPVAFELGWTMTRRGYAKR